MPKKTPKKRDDCGITKDEYYETIGDLGTALFFRTSFLLCPVCQNMLLNGLPHNESCRFFVVEKLAKNLGIESLKKNLKAVKF